MSKVIVQYYTDGLLCYTRFISSKTSRSLAYILTFYKGGLAYTLYSFLADFLSGDLSYTVYYFLGDLFSYFID